MSAPQTEIVTMADIPAAAEKAVRLLGFRNFSADISAHYLKLLLETAFAAGRLDGVGAVAERLGVRPINPDATIYNEGTR